MTLTSPQSSLHSVSDQELKRLIARSSPAGLAAVHSRGKWTLAPHLKLLNQKFLWVAEQIQLKKNPRLIDTMPPRHGKSELGSRYLPAWFVGRFPDQRVILTSYEASFAAEWGEKARDILEEVGPQYFDVSVSRTHRARDAWNIEGHSGGMRTAGSLGPITGKGSELFLIDDPVKGDEEANSPVYREKTWNAYRSNAYTRVEPGGGIICTQTRWHEEDLTGKILANAKETGEHWEILHLPALSFGADVDPLGREEGAALWPERFDTEALARRRGVLGSYRWSALYQGEPQPADGGCFKRSWFRYWSHDETGLYRLRGPDGDRLVSPKHCRYFLTVDLAFSLKKEADYTVIAAWAVTPQHDLILVDLQRERLEGPQLVPQIQQAYRKYGAQYVGIEEVAAQALVIQAARQSGLTVRSLKADKDKLSRAIPATVRMEAGQIWLPDGAPWLGEFEHELLSFPRGTHDDMVDVTSYAAVEVQRFGPAAEPDSLTELREYAETELAAEFFNRADNPVFWAGDDDEL